MEFNYANVNITCERYAAMQTPAEVYYLLRFLRPRNVGTIVELGVHRGGMAATLLTFLPGSRLIGVEVLPVGSPHPAIEAVPLPPDAPTLSQTLAEFGDRMTVVEGVSYDPASLERAFELVGRRDGKPFDFVFIDASHDYDSVRWDYERWSPHARLVGFHDLYSADILRYWREITGGRSIRTCCAWKEADGNGIGLVL